MKRFISIISVLFVLIVSFYTWLWYRDYTSYEHALPSNAGLVVKLDVDQLIQRAVWHKIKNPGELFKRSDTKEDKEESLQKIREQA